MTRVIRDGLEGLVLKDVKVLLPHCYMSFDCVVELGVDCRVSTSPIRDTG